MMKENMQQNRLVNTATSATIVRQNYLSTTSHKGRLCSQQNTKGFTKKTINSSHKTRTPAREPGSTTNNSSPKTTQNTDPGTRSAVNLLQHCSKDFPLTSQQTHRSSTLGQRRELRSAIFLTSSQTAPSTQLKHHRSQQ